MRLFTTRASYRQNISKRNARSFSSTLLITALSFVSVTNCLRWIWISTQDHFWRKHIPAESYSSWRYRSESLNRVLSHNHSGTTLSLILGSLNMRQTSRSTLRNAMSANFRDSLSIKKSDPLHKDAATKSFEILFRLRSVSAAVSPFQGCSRSIALKASTCWETTPLLKIPVQPVLL